MVRAPRCHSAGGLLRLETTKGNTRVLQSGSHVSWAASTASKIEIGEKQDTFMEDGEVNLSCERDRLLVEPHICNTIQGS